MRGFGYWGCRSKAAARHLGREDRGAQLVEFAVALPLLVVFVVGIFDFSGAFTLKQKLTNVARDAARAAAADPSNDVSVGAVAPPPVSVAAAFQVVNNYFVANKLNTCGVSSSPTSSGLTWTYSGTTGGCPPGGLTIVINRGYYFPASAGATIANVSCQPQSAGSTNRGALHVRQHSIRVPVALWPGGQFAGFERSSTRHDHGHRCRHERKLMTL